MNIANKADFAAEEHISIDQFFPLVCSEAHRHKVIWQKRASYERVWRVFDCSKTIIEDWNCDWLELGKHEAFFTQCQEMYDNWDYGLMEPLEVCISDKAHNLENGHHRSFVLGSLILQKKVQFEPLPVLNTAKLMFDPDSDKIIRLIVSSLEFLNVLKLTSEPTAPIGEIPSRIRLTDIKLYEQKVIEASEKYKEWHLSKNPPVIINAQIEQLINASTSFDNLVIESDHTETALAIAFICDAIVSKLKFGKVIIPMLSQTIEINPPYVKK